TRDFVANLYVSLKSNPLSLITGPPGHGKSSVVAALARALGHGNALLEIAVRRSWSDDRYLLGFFDTFHGRYDPGPTGLATRLLDRTGMIFLTARDVSRSLTVAEARAQAAHKGVRARQLMQELARSANQCPEEPWDRMDPLLEILRRQTDALGSGTDLSPRV